MPLPGGASDKAGNRYELLWTVVNMARVLNGEVESICLEPVGGEGEGVEFTTVLPSGTEYHQVKRQRTGHGVWSLAALQAEGVLGHFCRKLDVQSAKTVFISAHAAHPLDELAERSRSAASWEEFEKWFLSSNAWSKNFNDLHQRWGLASNEESYERLKRVQVSTISEKELRELANAKLGILLDGDIENATDILQLFALDHIHHTLTADDIWHHLRQRGFNRQTWADQDSVTHTINELNRTYQASMGPLGIAGESIRRSETDQLLGYFEDEDSRKVVLVTGTAGVGKTTVISQVLSDAECLNLPTLALRVDRLEPSGRPEELGRQLGLPASPIRTLAAVARDQECLLVIDQLDAISMASGRNPQLFDCIRAMLDEACQHPNMRVLSACRKFDVDYDNRLHDLVSENGVAREFRVEPFDAETVHTLLARLGFDPGDFVAKQIDLLAVPLQMYLLSEVAKVGGVDTGALQTAKDLYDAFWHYKRQVLQSRGVTAERMRIVIDLMVDHMTGRESLFVPESLLDDHADVMSALESENILVRDGSRLSFFHEGFLDYAFARRMVATGDDLAAYILAGEQSLFVRSQVRQVLLHRRGGAPGDALRDVDAILNGDGIRVHLKAIVISLMAALDDPNEDEWRLLEPLLVSDLSHHVLRSINGSTPWFDLLDTIGVLGRWLSGSDEDAINRALWLMHGVLRSRPDQVARLLSPFLGRSAAWDQRLMYAVLAADLETSRSLFDLALALVNTGAADQNLTPQDGSAGFWWSIYELADGNAEWACELAAACCNRLLALTLAAGGTNPFDMMSGPSSSDALGVQQASKGAPRTFVNQLLPFVFDVVNSSADQSRVPPWHDPVWHPAYYANGHSFGDMFLLSMESAVRWLAENDPYAFRQIAGQFQASGFEIIHFLLVRGYQANGEVFADEAADYVAGALARFGGRYLTRARWATANLIQAVTPHCLDASLAPLERAILDHYTPFEMTPAGAPYQGEEQFKLLSAVDELRLSPPTRIRLGELRRKFPEPGDPGPSIIEATIVGSPIPENSARQMTDANWLRAMARYGADFNPSGEDIFSGGAVELSRVLETMTKDDPSRFAGIRCPTISVQPTLKPYCGDWLAPNLVSIKS